MSHQPRDMHGSGPGARVPAVGPVAVCASCGARFAAGDESGKSEHHRQTGHSTFRFEPVVETR